MPIRRATFGAPAGPLCMTTRVSASRSRARVRPCGATLAVWRILFHRSRIRTTRLRPRSTIGETCPPLSWPSLSRSSKTNCCREASRPWSRPRSGSRACRAHGVRAVRGSKRESTGRGLATSSPRLIPRRTNRGTTPNSPHRPGRRGLCCRRGLALSQRLGHHARRAHAHCRRDRGRSLLGVHDRRRRRAGRPADLGTGRPYATVHHAARDAGPVAVRARRLRA